MSAYRTVNEIISYYSVTLAAVGTAGNMIVLSICLRKSLRSVPTFVFVAFMSLTDSFSLYYWNLNDYFLTFYGFTIGDFSEFSCRITTFFQNWFSQSSSWLLVALALERYLSVKIKNWRNLKFNNKKAAIVSLALVSFFFILDFHLNLTLTFTPVANKTVAGVCYGTKMYKDWRALHTYIYSMVPFAILLLINCLLIYQVLNAKSSASSELKSSKNRSMSISVIAFTIAFLILTGPHAICGGYFLQALLVSELGRVIIYSTACIAYTFHGANLLILLLTNKKFSQEFKQFLTDMKIMKKNKISAESKTNNTQSTREGNQ